jgi:hypothetical protein
VTIGATFVVAAAHIYVIYIASRRRSADHANQVTLDTEKCVLIRMSRATKTSYLVLSVAGLVLMESWPVFAWTLPPEGLYGEGPFRLFAPVAPIFGLYFVGVLCSRIVRKRREMGVGLSRAEIYYWTWFGCCFFAWAWISEIQLTSRTGTGARLEVHEPLEHPRTRRRTG